MPWTREDVVANSVEAVGWGCGCVCVVLGGGWKDCNVDRAANWLGEESRLVDMALCGSCVSSGRGGRRGSVGGWSKVSQVWRSSCKLGKG